MDPLVDIIWMRKGKDQSRSIEADGKINQLMSGSHRGYPGDRYIDDEGNPTNIKLQIHFIKPKDMDDMMPVMALYMQFSCHLMESLNSNMYIRKGDLDDY